MCTNTSNVGRIYSSPPACILRVYSSRVCSIQLVQLDVYAKQMQTTIPNWLLSSLCTCTAQVSVKKGIRRSLSFILTTTLHQWHQSTKYGVCPCSDLFKHCEMATTINQAEIFESLSWRTLLLCKSFWMQAPLAASAVNQLFLKVAF